MAMTDSNHTNSSIPRELELPVSTSACSMDVSMISYGSSHSSLGSLSWKDRNHSRKEPIKRRKSPVKFVISFSTPFRKPSYPRLSQTKLNRMAPGDVAANLPARKSLDQDHLVFPKDLIVALPKRKESEVSFTSSVRKCPIRMPAMSPSRSSSSYSRRKNFEWNASGKSTLPKENRARAMSSPSALISPRTTSPKKDNMMWPPARPLRRGSVVVDAPPVWSSSSNRVDVELSPVPGSNSNMPPPLPSRKQSLIDFEDVEHSSNARPVSSTNFLWSMPVLPTGKASMDMASIFVDEPRQKLFRAVPPMTKFEKQTSSDSAELTKKTSRKTILALPMPPFHPQAFPDWSCTSNSGDSVPPLVPQRKESMMS